MRLSTSAATALLILNSGAYALEFGERTTSNGTSILVEEDFMNGQYPRHIIALSSTDQTTRDGRLYLRCQENRTEAYYVSGPFEFFRSGAEPQLYVRFPSQGSATRYSAALSTDNEAVFLSDPTQFITRLVEDGSVGMSGTYYSGSFRQNFSLDQETREAIYDLATTCEWIARLPERSVSVSQPSESGELFEILGGLRKEYGAKTFDEAVSALQRE